MPLVLSLLRERSTHRRCGHGWESVGVWAELEDSSLFQRECFMKDVGHRAASAAAVCCAWADRCAVAGVQDFAAQEHCVSALLQDRSHDISIPVKEGGVGSAHWPGAPVVEGRSNALVWPVP